MVIREAVFWVGCLIGGITIGVVGSGLTAVLAAFVGPVAVVPFALVFVVVLLNAYSVVDWWHRVVYGWFSRGTDDE